uniref:Uncharacterized protein n=1 Tax=Chrysemys picta bellii TaxID=8478 RepID=A0A8C3IZD0_CHRPI
MPLVASASILCFVILTIRPRPPLHVFPFSTYCTSQIFPCIFRHESQPGFQVIRSYSIAVTRQDEIKLPDNIPVTRKTNKRLQATDIDEDNQELDAAYVNPIASDYFNCGMFLRPANEKEEDSCSYQNVVIGASNSAESDDVDDYENSASIKIWKQSNISESPDDYPDYVNSDVAAVPN